MNVPEVLVRYIFLNEYKVLTEARMVLFLHHGRPHLHAARASDGESLHWHRHSEFQRSISAVSKFHGLHRSVDRVYAQRVLPAASAPRSPSQL